ncbi:MAG: hypothetical protein EBZ74_05830 [Planctomycetia bacterium]|nr:hypothetical protein [Planctomycetia bacterium]
MKCHPLLCLAAAVLACAVAEAGGAGRCRSCGPGLAGTETPCGDTGCGPRYRGEIHEPSRCDPCDACNRWRGCDGATQAPEMLAPWQLPPGRGFTPPEQLGYATRTCP